MELCTIFSSIKKPPHPYSSNTLNNGQVVYMVMNVLFFVKLSFSLLAASQAYREIQDHLVIVFYFQVLIYQN